MKFPSDIKTQGQKEEYLLEIFSFLSKNAHYLARSKGEGIKERAIKLCKVTLRKIEGKPELTSSAKAKAEFHRNFNINRYVNKIPAKYRSTKNLPDGFAIFKFPFSRTEYMSSSKMDVFFGNTPHDSEVLGTLSQNYPLSFFTRGFVTQGKDLVLCSCIPILEHEDYCPKISLYVESLGRWRQVFSTFDVNFVLITSCVLDEKPFKDIRRGLKDNNVNVFKSNSSLSTSTNMEECYAFFKGLQL